MMANIAGKDDEIVFPFNITHIGYTTQTIIGYSLKWVLPPVLNNIMGRL